MHMILKVTVLWQQQALMFTLVHITKIAIFVLSVNYDVQMKKSKSTIECIHCNAIKHVKIKTYSVD